MKSIPVLILALLLSFPVISYSQNAAGDTTWVQTFNFDSISSRRAWFTFPDNSHTWNQVLMYYTIKCDPQTPYDGYECGEWDYTTFTHVYKHTGELDSTSYLHPYFTANGQAPDSFAYVTEQAWEYMPFAQSSYSVSDTISLSTVQTGTGTTQIGITQGSNSKLLLLYPASDLANDGLTQGAIHRLKYKFTQAGIQFRHFRIRMKHTAETGFSPGFDDTTNMQFVYDAPLTTTENGWINCLLYPGFEWDGSSSLLVELSCDDPSQAAIMDVDPSATYSAMLFNEPDAYLAFEGPDYLEVPAEAFSDIDQEITISMWVNGDPGLQPQNDMLFEAENADGNRLLNVHLPWGNGSVYWDAGYADGSYDRIDKAASTAEYAGNWNHWAFVKNAAEGSMKIYLNGELWHSGNGKSKSMAGITRFILGGDKSTNPERSYDGFIDEFRVFKSALSQEEIQSCMYIEYNNMQSHWDDLSVYYPMNSMASGILPDQSSNTYHAHAIGMPRLKEYAGFEKYRSATILNYRALTVFEQGSFTQQDSIIWHTDSVPAEQICLRRYEVSDNTLLPIDTAYIWNVWKRYSYDPETGEALDSVLIPAEEIIYQAELTTYSDPFELINTIQIQNFVTPYGINLELGDDGFTYVYDVTDYAFLFHDSVDLQAHNTQELLDLRFAFIEGPPARELIDFKQIWRGNYGHHAIAEDEALPAVPHKIHEDAEQVILRTRTTGHGMQGNAACAEFCPTVHHLNIDAVERYSWENWTECADNPVYPQGGTWIFDRAGWCPGSFADTYNWDITDWSTPGDSVEIDYGMTQYPVGDGGGNYQVAVQCFQYAAPTHTYDAAISDIISPSDADLYRRFNPACGQAEIRIQNRGSEVLTNLHIDYGLDGNLDYGFDWSGSLAFMEDTSILLPPVDWQEVAESEMQFTAELSAPNGQSDEFPGNNIKHSHFEMVSVYDNPVMLVVKPNNYGSETSYDIRTANGDIIKEVDNLESNTYYYDTLDYAPGCYEIRIYDAGEDGLSFWYNTAAGNGLAAIRNVGGIYVEVFDPDFGSFIRHQFIIPDNEYIESEFAQKAHFSLHPNPANDKVTISLDKAYADKARIRMYNLYGRMVYEGDFFPRDSLDYDMSLCPYAKGMYFIEITNGKMHQTQKLIIR